MVKEENKNIKNETFVAIELPCVIQKYTVLSVYSEASQAGCWSQSAALDPSMIATPVSLQKFIVLL